LASYLNWSDGSCWNGITYLTWSENKRSCS
jgi:hypothetical protein